jgi:hypothetical protein
MGDVPPKRVNRGNAMLRSNAALRLRRARAAGHLASPAAAPATVTDPSGEPISVAQNSAEQRISADEEPRVESIPALSNTESRAEIKPLTDVDLADAVARRITEMRDLLLGELQSSFAGLRADQAFAWSEQTAILKSLSEELTAGVSVEQAVPRLNHVPEQQAGPPSAQKSSLPQQSLPQQSLPQQSLPQQSRPSNPVEAVKPAPLSASDAAGPADAIRRWEAIRQSFLQNDGRDLVESADDRPSVSRSQQSQPDPTGRPPVALAIAARNAAELSDSEFADVLPEPLDIEQIPDSDLRSVFLSRERLLAELIGRYRRRREHQQELLSAEQLRGLHSQLPGDLETLVNRSLNRIDELTRLSELELAFERARLSRERKQLEQSRFLLENHARQLGLTLNPDGTISRSDDSSGRPAGRRWLGKLGFGSSNNSGRDPQRRS